MHRKKILIFCLFVLLGGIFIYITMRAVERPLPSKPSVETVLPTPPPPPPPAGFNKQLYSIETASSPWVVVNKSRPLPKGYKPAQLVVSQVKLRLDKTAEQMQTSSVMAESLAMLFAAAKEAGNNLIVSSGYRSEALQKSFYDSYVAKDGVTQADRYSARPGYSEHQTGLAVDVGGEHGCLLEVCFGNTPEGKWLAANAASFGFIIRYPSPEKEQATGYQYEPWHLRYVGIELAQEIAKTGQTMEEFFGLPAPQY